LTDLGWLGVDLLIVSVAVIVIEGVMIANDGSSLAKRARLLSERLATEQVLLKTCLLYTSPSPRDLST